MKRLFLFLCLTACAGAPQYYLIPEASRSNHAAPLKQHYALRNIQLPDYLQEMQWFLNRQGQITFQKESRWLTAPAERIPALLHHYLSQAGHVHRYPLLTDVPLSALVDVSIQEWILDEQTQTLNLQVEYLHSRLKPESIQKHRFEKRFPLAKMDEASILQAHQTAIRDLGEHIIQSLEP